MKKLTKKEWIAAAVSLGFITYMFFGNTVTDALNNLNGQSANVVGSVSESSVQAEDKSIGTGIIVEKGMQVAINYVLRLSDGTVIQDSKLVNGGAPFTFIVGGGQLLSGWEDGIVGMRVGGKRLILIPPELGYGDQQVGPIPPNSTLIFEIQVVSAFAAQ